MGKGKVRINNVRKGRSESGRIVTSEMNCVVAATEELSVKVTMERGRRSEQGPLQGRSAQLGRSENGEGRSHLMRA